MTEPRIAVLDIETKPIVAHTWGLWNVNIGLNQIMEPGGVIGFGIGWHGSKKVTFYSDYHHGHDVMVQKAYEVFEEADVLVTYNGLRFDVPHLKAEFLMAGMTPQKPVQQVDLFKVVKSNFRFPSSKLQFVTTAVGLAGKLQTGGHQLWVDCMNGDDETKRKAWARMSRYCKQDVAVTSELFDVLRPWIKTPPHAGLFSGTDCCANCGGTDLERRGFAYTALATYQQYQCRTCGKWSRSGKSVDRVDMRGTS